MRSALGTDIGSLATIGPETRTGKVWPRGGTPRSTEEGVERVRRVPYAICVLQALREQLRCKEIWVVGAARYRNPEEDLPQDFATARASYYASLNLPRDSAAFLSTLRQRHEAALTMLHDGLATNRAVRILPKGKGWIAPRDSGSPPRAWGQRLPPLAIGVRHRFTPTSVGTTAPCATHNPRHAVHPHERGDNPDLPAAQACTTGSPPRAWGQPRRAAAVWWCRRFTPTSVGTTCSLRRRCGAVPVHPHERGDNDRITYDRDSKDGSPPRAWGQRRGDSYGGVP